ncbi:ABC transporter permease, partial [Pandoraea communis]|uniref:ABC transporter permease n=1 Tax=Pandoraea communis TaxID=2508297 RepID=UPI0025A797C0|nr:ABC transporter permease [Pandoraea communis]MDM8359758.1 ABC transporter permease [Pandoraea communis]
MNHRQPSRAALLSVGFASVVVFLLAWETACRSGIVDPLFLPPPSAVGERIVSMLADGSLLANVLASTRRVMTGFIAATVV